MLAHDAQRVGSFRCDVDRLAVDDARPAFHDLRAVLLEQCADAAGEAVDDAVLPLHRATDLDPRRIDADAERRVLRVMARLLELVRRMDHRLRWDAADVETGAAQLVAFDQRRDDAELRRTDRRDVTAGATADHEERGCFCFHAGWSLNRVVPAQKREPSVVWQKK